MKKEQFDADLPTQYIGDYRGYHRRDKKTYKIEPIYVYSFLVILGLLVMMLIIHGVRP